MKPPNTETIVYIHHLDEKGKWKESGKTSEGCIIEVPGAAQGKPGGPNDVSKECCNYELECKMTTCSMEPLGQSRCDKEFGPGWKDGGARFCNNGYQGECCRPCPKQASRTGCTRG